MSLTYLIVIAFFVGVIITYFYFLIRDKKFTSTAKQEAEKLLDQAKREKERVDKEAKIQIKEQILQHKLELEKEQKEKRKDFQVWEKRLISKEENLDKKMSLLDSRDEKIKSKETEINSLEGKLQTDRERLKEKLREVQISLEKIAMLSTEEAKKMQIELIINEAKHDAAKTLKEIEENLKEESEKKAMHILSTAVQRYAGDFVSEKTISTVVLPSDEMKGRIIGREGRNIRAIEAATGVDLIIDDTPEAVVISSFDPVKRETAKLTIERLITDGRIHPGRIEEIAEKCKKEVEKEIKEAGERALYEIAAHGIHTEILKLVGTLKYRTSYTQNQYMHSLEVSFLAGLIAAELGLNVKLAKRAGLLHDIGKALDHSIEGSHAQIGADLAKKYGESEEIVHAIRAHHEEEKPNSVLAVLIQAADALSSARPGARREMLETYIKRVEDLEKIANSFEGVDKSYAIQAGREIRVIVNSENISDTDSFTLSKDIAKKIEDDLSYPGQIKVTVIRETRAIGLAK
jgi:ribonucrease Y